MCDELGASGGGRNVGGTKRWLKDGRNGQLTGVDPGRSKDMYSSITSKKINYSSYQKEALGKGSSVNVSTTLFGACSGRRTARLMSCFCDERVYHQHTQILPCCTQRTPLRTHLSFLTLPSPPPSIADDTPVRPAGLLCPVCLVLLRLSSASPPPPPYHLLLPPPNTAPPASRRHHIHTLKLPPPPRQRPRPITSTNSPPSYTAPARLWQPAFSASGLLHPTPHRRTPRSCPPSSTQQPDILVPTPIWRLRATDTLTTFPVLRRTRPRCFDVGIPASCITPCTSGAIGKAIAHLTSYERDLQQEKGALA